MNIQKRFFPILIIAAAFVLIGFSQAAAQDEEIEITTYYPAPYGDYEQVNSNISTTNIALFNPVDPSDSASPVNVITKDKGMLIYDSTDDYVKQWDPTASSGAGDWIRIRTGSRNIRMWDSDWIDIDGDARGNTYTFTHDLNAVPRFVQIWVSLDPNSGQMFRCDNSGAYGSGDSGVTDVYYMSSTEIKIRFGRTAATGYILRSRAESNTFVTITNEDFFVRVVALY